MKFDFTTYLIGTSVGNDLREDMQSTVCVKCTLTNFFYRFNLTSHTKKEFEEYVNNNFGIVDKIIWNI